MRRFFMAVALVGFSTAFASAQQFPFSQEMLLETKPMPGSRRVPMMEIHPDGKASVDLWCHSAAAEVAISGDTIKFTFTSAKPEACTPERIERDQQMAKALLEITNWRRERDIVTLVGPTSYRFRISTH